MRWQDLAEENCSVARTVSIIGDRWTILMLRDCFNGSKRFDEFQDSLGISRSIVRDRLNLLVQEGVLEKSLYQERPARYEYRLTDKGLDLYPILMSFFGWGDKYYSDKSGPPVKFKHNTCGHDFHAETVCSKCREVLNPKQVTVRHSKS